MKVWQVSPPHELWETSRVAVELPPVAPAAALAFAFGVPGLDPARPLGKVGA